MTLAEMTRRALWRGLSAWLILAAYGLTLNYGDLLLQAAGVPA